MKSPEMPATAAESVVVTAERAAAAVPTVGSFRVPWAARVEPGLKPYQPNHRRNVPST